MRQHIDMLCRYLRDLETAIRGSIVAKTNVAEFFRCLSTCYRCLRYNAGFSFLSAMDELEMYEFPDKYFRDKYEF